MGGALYSYRVSLGEAVHIVLSEWSPASRSIELVFKTLYPSMTPGDLGLMFLPLVIGSILGLLTNFWQEAIYRLVHSVVEGCYTHRRITVGGKLPPVGLKLGSMALVVAFSLSLLVRVIF